jgi:hypothetical protein
MEYQLMAEFATEPSTTKIYRPITDIGRTLPREIDAILQMAKLRRW